LSRADWIKLMIAAARLPLRSEPAKSQSAKLNGHDPYTYLKDVRARRPTQRASEISELLPHKWLPLRNL
jgi:hypothetical protein